MRRLLIIATGTTYPEIAQQHGEFEDWFADGLVCEGVELFRRSPPSGDELPDPASCDGVVVTGSPAMVTDRADWSEATAAWLRQAVALRLPLLGVCYGHQLLAHALGGRVDYHPGGREIGTHGISVHEASIDDPLFGGLEKSFLVHLTHMQSVRELPPGAVLLAGNAFEPHQAFRVGDCAWGVQFHPEFTPGIMQAYLHRLSDRMRGEGMDPDRVLQGIQPTPVARQLLQRFVELVRGDDQDADET